VYIPLCTLQEKFANTVGGIVLYPGFVITLGVMGFCRRKDSYISARSLSAAIMVASITKIHTELSPYAAITYALAAISIQSLMVCTKKLQIFAWPL
jgi:hypothetical protein